MDLTGQLIAQSPVYRGNAVKTMFTRDGDGKQKLVSLPGKIDGTAQGLMDAFIDESRNKKNKGLLNQGWERFYDEEMPKKLINQVECKLNKNSYLRDRFFDLRMGIKLDEDRWAMIANANYKMETVFKNAFFDFSISINAEELKKGENQAKLYYLLNEIKAGRFWFGAGKNKGLGNVRLEMDLSALKPKNVPFLKRGVNHLHLELSFDCMNPVLIGWNWGKKDADATKPVSGFTGEQFLKTLSLVPEFIIDRLNSLLGGPIISLRDWKKKLKENLPKTIAIWLKQSSSREQTILWTLPSSELAKQSKGKHPLSPKVLSKVEPLCKTPFSSKEEAESAIKKALGKKANMAKRLSHLMEKRTEEHQKFNREAWVQIADAMNLSQSPPEDIVENITDEKVLAKLIEPFCEEIVDRLSSHVKQQIDLAQSDTWIDVKEISKRKDHLKIKQMLMKEEIDEYQWGNEDQSPKGVEPAVWKEFVKSHANNNVQFRHMRNQTNLSKSITNDKNFIDFLTSYRDKARQELSREHHIDFRAGGQNKREISRKYGKPYDKVFMRMLTWSPSNNQQGQWEIYIPGSTIKGAFRKRASQILKTVKGETSNTQDLLDFLFGRTGNRKTRPVTGKVIFSDAYLTDPIDDEKAWCSVDGVKMDPKTARPSNNSKQDFLIAYGDHLKFNLKIDIQDIHNRDLEALSVLFHLLSDFQRGDIPVGGDRNNGSGWIQAAIPKLTWLTSSSDEITEKLFGNQSLIDDGIWKKITLQGPSAIKALQPFQNLQPQENAGKPIPQANAGFISHRAFGGHCGTLTVEAQVLTPLSIRESGEPSFTTSQRWRNIQRLGLLFFIAASCFP